MFDKLDSELEVKMIDKLSPNTPAWSTANFCVMIRPLVTWTVSETMLLYTLYQGVVTSCVEVFATEIKIESRDQSPF